MSHARLELYLWADQRVMLSLLITVNMATRQRCTEALQYFVVT
jgi:hypothetical protein